ncbi:MAG: hypothetical protein ACD_5C00125G0002 [uncultured bacterium]|nr:MAG: hypothetical protein ACD_5C00125G0002 [uncultured bacterium]
MKKSSIIIIVVLAVIAGIMIGRISGYFDKGQTVAEKKPLYWIDTMEPTIHYPGPGKSRMGMQLVPVYPDEAQSEDKTTVRISPAIVNNLGVRTVLVTQGELARRIETVGYVEPNENKISHIHTYADGWIKNLLVKTVGEAVKKDQIIMQLYSPALINAQEEYLIALGSHNQSLINASYKKLQTLHISEQQIQRLKKTKHADQLIDIYAHQDGVVTELNVREGMRVTPETEMMSLVDLSSIWMIAQIFEEQASWVKVGESAEARLSAFPGKIWKGEVEYIYPQVDPTTRTLKVRFRFHNPDEILKPNMYANITLFAEPKSKVLSIPLEALIRSSQSNRVIVSLSDGRFQARTVTTGIESGDKIEILSGLKAGEKVVVSGQFLIDSETNLKAGLERLEPSSSASNNQIAEEKNTSIEGKGIIKTIKASTHSLTLQHEPIPVLNWPEMTMDFSVAKNVDLNLFKADDHIQFSLEKDKENHFVITEMKKLSH